MVTVVLPEYGGSANGYTLGEKAHVNRDYRPRQADLDDHIRGSIGVIDDSSTSNELPNLSQQDVRAP